ncbi:MAG TPA: flavin reductase family protein [Capillimicrobium sp.]|nr:flavin reductase family protein [Capillimicrobium sp.]
MHSVAGDTTATNPQRFRHVLGHLPTGLAVVTALHDGEPVGMVVNSLTSVSLDPPLVLFCPALTSTTWPRIEAASGFCVNVMAADAQDVCARLAGRRTNRFEGVTHDLTAGGHPVLEGTLAWLDCRLWRQYPGGDHIIAVGRVDALDHRPGEPLVFFRSTYRRLSRPNDRHIDG